MDRGARGRLTGWRGLRRRRGVRIVLIVTLVLMAAVALRLSAPGPLTSLREAAFDHFQQLSPRAPEDGPVQVVDIDEASLAELGQWPWPRTRIASLVERLQDLGAAAVVFDIVFAEPDRSSPARLARDLLDAGAALVEALERMPDHDAVLASAFARAAVVVGFAAHGQIDERRPPAKAGFAWAGADPRTILPAFKGSTATLAGLSEAASGIGAINLSRNDVQGVVRRMPMLLTDGTTLYPSLGLEALRVAQGQSTILVRSTGASGEAAAGAPALVDARVGRFRVPLTADGEMWLRFASHRPDAHVSAREVLRRDGVETLRERIEGRIVLIGTSAAALHDLRATPLREVVPGVVIHAQALEQIIAGSFLTRPDWADGVEIALAVLLSCALVLLLARLGARLAQIVGAGFVAAIVGGAFLAFDRMGFLVDPVFPLLTAGTAYLLVLAFLYLTSDRERRLIRNAFAQYIAPELLRRIERAPEPPRLGGEIKPMTVLFMDVRDFTPISEALSPEDLVHFLNALFSPLSDAVLERQGTIDKYIGDSLMAFWNAPVDVPDHPAQAIRAALTMREAVRLANETDAFGFAAKGRPDLRVRIGIGLNTGDACVGNIGSDKRFNYSVIGDTVNVAARIESSCKDVGFDLLVSDACLRGAPGFAALEAGVVPLKGKAEPVTLYAVLGDEAVARTPAFQDLAAAHRDLLDALGARDPLRALHHLLRCRTKAGADLAAFYQRFEREIRAIGQATAAGPLASPIAAAG